MTSPIQRAVDTGRLWVLAMSPPRPTLPKAGTGMLRTRPIGVPRRFASSWRTAAGRQQRRDRHPQAEHRRCLRQGLAQRQRRRGVGVRAGRQRRIQAMPASRRASGAGLRRGRIDSGRRVQGEASLHAEHSDLRDRSAAPAGVFGGVDASCGPRLPVRALGPARRRR